MCGKQAASVLTLTKTKNKKRKLSNLRLTNQLFFYCSVFLFLSYKTHHSAIVHWDSSLYFAEWRLLWVMNHKQKPIKSITKFIVISSFDSSNDVLAIACLKCASSSTFPEYLPWFFLIGSTWLSESLKLKESSFNRALSLIIDLLKKC